MSKVQVAVRCRPKLPHEQNVPANKIECNEVTNTIAVTGATTAGTQGGTTKTFTFDKVIPENASQEDIFDYVSPMVDHALDGLHSTVFAYGQTGSGKTFTMEGYDYAPAHNNKLQPKEDTPAHQHGIVPRIIQLAFDRARERMGGRATADEADEFDQSEDGGGAAADSDIRYSLKCSFVQLYNERVTDLLNPSSSVRNKEGLRLRWTRNDQFVVENLFTFECSTADQMRDMFLTGVKEKVMGSHHMNVQSSRSHCLFTIHVHSWNTHNPELVRKAELTLVDLAGSEKLALLSQNPSAKLLKESIEINTSLLALGKVITALATRGSKGGKSAHIPYRDSKLTKLLKHALGGNSMTIMIACINPLDPYVEESVSTLLYAGRARNITNEPTVNDDPRSALIRSLRDEITTLKTELEYYRQLVVNGVVDDKLAAQLTDKLEKAKRDTGAQRAILSSGGDGESGTMDESGSGQTTKELELAEKLIESCKILKNLMGVNGQLRDAFDKLKASKEKLEQREVSVNAENTALRERIEMLESIALQEEEGTDDDESTNNYSATNGGGSEEDGGDGSRKGSFTRKHVPVKQEAQRQQQVAAISSSSQPSKRRSTQPAPPSSRPQSSSGRSTPTPDAAVQEDRYNNSAPNSRMPNSNNAAYYAPPPPPLPQPKQQRTPSTNNKKAPSPKRAKPGGGAQQHQKNRGGSSGLGFYQKQLQAYANKYRNPTKAPSYEEYYGRSSVRNPLGVSGGRYDVGARQMETTGGPNVQQQQIAITKKSQEVAALLSKLSKNLPESTVALMPASLQGGASNFGSLGFGGTGTERDELEDKRRAREDRLRQLREQNQNLGTKSYFDGPLASNINTGNGASAAASGYSSAQVLGRGGGGSGLNLASTYSGAHDDALSHHNYLSSYPQQEQHQQLQHGGAPAYGGQSPAQRGRRAAPQSDQSYQQHQPMASTSSAGSATGKLFQYLSQEETHSAFSTEQLEKLKRRSESINNTTSGGNTAHLPRASSTDPVASAGSRPISSTNTPRQSSAPNSTNVGSATGGGTPHGSSHSNKKHPLSTNRIGGGVPQPMALAPSNRGVGGGGTHGSSSSVVSNSPLSQASSSGGSGNRGRRNGPHVTAVAAASSSYQRDPTKQNPSYTPRSQISNPVGNTSATTTTTMTPSNPSYIARLSEAVGLSTLAPSGNLTPRTKSSYEMGVYNTPPNPNRGGHPPTVSQNQQPRVAAHEAMQRRGDQVSEQQRYQQQMYEAQKALMDQQSKMANHRR